MAVSWPELDQTQTGTDDPVRRSDLLGEEEHSPFSVALAEGTRKRRKRVISMFGVVPPVGRQGRNWLSNRTVFKSSGAGSPHGSRLQNLSDWKAACEQTRCS